MECQQEEQGLQSATKIQTFYLSTDFRRASSALGVCQEIDISPVDQPQAPVPTMTNGPLAPAPLLIVLPSPNDVQDAKAEQAAAAAV